MVDREQIKIILQQILQEEMQKPSVKKVPVQSLVVTEQDRFATGDPNHRVYTHDLLSLEESPRMGCGIMEMEQTTFPWKLLYDEIDYVLRGTLQILSDDLSVTAEPGEMIFIPKGSKICFSAKDRVRFLYVTAPADWKNQKETG